MSTMIRAYLRTLRPLLQPSGEAVGLRNAFGLESQLLRRAFTSVPPRAGPTRLPILPKTGRGINSRPRPTTNPATTTNTTITTRKSLRSPLPTTRHKRSFHKTSRLRNSKPAPGPASRQSSSTNGAAPQEPQSLSARLKKLSREYGWAAVGVYLGLSVLDFPFCFLLVRIVGTDKIGQIEEWVVSHATRAIPESVRIRWREYRAALKESRQEHLGDSAEEVVEVAGWGVAEAEQANQAGASLGTQLALAYAIHKSFIFFRVPLTAAVTPKVVKVLRSWGWNIGKRKTKGRARRT